MSLSHSVKNSETHQLSSQELGDHIKAFLEDHKAIDVMLLPLEGKSALADFLIIASGGSQRHIHALADHLIFMFKKDFGIIPKVEGLQQCDWVLVDGKDVLIHLFRPEVRSFYNLEKMWSKSFDDLPDQIPNPSSL